IGDSGDAERHAQPPHHLNPPTVLSSIVSGLRWRIGTLVFQKSFSCLRLRGGHGLPALIAARFASRIATICRVCDLVSSRRLTSPPRLPISARYSRTSFCVSLKASFKHAS